MPSISFRVTAFAIFSMAAAGAAIAAPATANLCLPGEKPLFQCSTKGKLLSLCASRDFSEKGGTLQYRFGTQKKIELQYPDTPQPAAGHFFFSSTGYSGGGEAHIRFKNGDVEYTLFDRTIRTGFGKGPNNPQFSSGVVVRDKNGKASSRSCGNDASIMSTAYEALPQEEFQDLD
ncbi:hypothetical protein PQR62_02920 [Herbaspirillum lusitanum]|uniref:Uncharacterized protein n=1 Tax=Herbaspirillum lusitanum TaxID=213312 RepID=A0ABW9A5D4_9BURK